MVTEAHISAFKQDPKNARRHTPRNAGMVADSIQRDGFGRAILAARDGTIIAGNQTLESAAEVGLENAIVVDSDGSKVIVVRRTDLDPNDAAAVRLAIADNRATDLSAFDPAVVLARAEEIDLSDFWNEDEIQVLIGSASTDARVPSLTELEQLHPEPLPDTFWPVIEVKVPPVLYDRYRALMEALDGETDAERFGALVTHAETQMDAVCTDYAS